jgi:hypothetical protein
MREYLGSLELRNERHIYRDGSRYYVEQVDGKGQLHTDIVSQQAIEYVLNELSGRYITVEDAAEILAPAARRLALPYSYGHKLNFYAQSVLLVLAVLGHAEIEKAGRRYHYQLSASSL